MKCKMCGADMETVSKDDSQLNLQCSKKCGFTVHYDGGYTFNDYKGMALKDYLWFRKLGLIKT